MARTYRCRRSVPHGWTMRDGGRLFHETLPTKFARRDHECPNGCEACRAPRFRRSIFQVESKANRKAWMRTYRAQVRDRLRHEDWEHIPRLLRTSGWDTW